MSLNQRLQTSKGIPLRGLMCYNILVVYGYTRRGAMGVRTSHKLRPARVNTEKILFDPNNPRFLDLRGEGRMVLEQRCAEPGVQEHAYQTMKDPRFDVRSLRSSIEQLGLLPIDRIVVRKFGDDQFVIAEGNRRLAAIRWLLEDHKTGEVTLPEDLVQSLREIEVLVLEEVGAQAVREQWLLQGVRHISGVKEWGPYQQARALETLIYEMGMDLREAAGALGLGPTQGKRKLNALHALEQMAEDDEYGTFAEPDMFSYFLHIMSKPVLRDEFLDWNEQDQTFTNEDNLRLVYSWITPDEEGFRKITRAIDLRDELTTVVAVPEALEKLKQPKTTLWDVVEEFRERRPEPIDWETPVRKALEVLGLVPADHLENLDEEKTTLLERLIQVAQKKLEQARKLSAG
jgi:hypothetical protein